jgi:hypothetical protein
VTTKITGLLSANMYAYCENDPVNFVDPTGYCCYDNISGPAGINLRATQGCLNPGPDEMVASVKQVAQNGGVGKGQVHRNMDDAAKAFGETYGQKSINDQSEYATYFYSSDGYVVYATVNVEEQRASARQIMEDYGAHGVAIAVPYNATGFIHTHFYVQGGANDNFGGEDIAGRIGIVEYVTTPSGYLRKFDPFWGEYDGDQGVIISTAMPIDPASGARRGRVRR